LTLLKHKNTKICLQIFKKHAKLTYLFIWKTMLQSVILLWKCVPCRNVGLCFGLWNPPTASLPNCISAPRVASWRKTQSISFHSIHRQVRLFQFVSSIWQPVSEEEGPSEKKPSPIFWIWTAIPSSTTRCQSYIQYSTFKLRYLFKKATVQTTNIRQLNISTKIIPKTELNLLKLFTKWYILHMYITYD